MGGETRDRRDGAGQDSAGKAAVGELVLFEDARAARLGPMCLNRPVFELVLGATTLRRRIERALGAPASAARVRPHLTALLPELGLAEAPPAGGALWVNAALGAANGAVWPAVASLAPGEALRSPEGRWLAFRARPGERGASDPDEGDAAEFGVGYAARIVPADGILTHAWELIGRQAEALAADLAADLAAGRQAGGAAHGAVTEGAEIEEPVCFDCRNGPVIVRPGAKVAAFTRLEGPVLIESGARVLGGRVAGSYIGPGCRVRGEVEASVLLGWSNKAHDGFLGHSYVGSWVNLGALTTTSDLKNNYGHVRMRADGESRSTGLQKIGSMIGDHAKTAIGTLLAAGTVIGVGANVFGCAGPAPAWFPSFAWGVGARARPYDFERFLATAALVQARRERILTAAEQAALTGALALSRLERETWLAQQAAERAAGSEEHA